MAVQVEGVVDGGMGGEEALRRSRRLESLHLAFSSSDRLMQVLGPVVRTQPLNVVRRETQAALSRKLLILAEVGGRLRIASPELFLKIVSLRH